MTQVTSKEDNVPCLEDFMTAEFIADLLAQMM